MKTWLEIHSEYVGDLAFSINDDYKTVTKKIENVLDGKIPCLIVDAENEANEPGNFILPKAILENSFILIIKDAKKEEGVKKSNKVIKMVKKDTKDV